MSVRGEQQFHTVLFQMNFLFSVTKKFLISVEKALTSYPFPTCCFAGRHWRCGPGGRAARTGPAAQWWWAGGRPWWARAGERPWWWALAVPAVWRPAHHSCSPGWWWPPRGPSRGWPGPQLGLNIGERSGSGFKIFQRQNFYCAHLWERRHRCWHSRRSSRDRSAGSQCPADPGTSR